MKLTSFVTLALSLNCVWILNVSATTDADTSAKLPVGGVVYDFVGENLEALPQKHIFVQKAKVTEPAQSDLSKQIATLNEAIDKANHISVINSDKGKTIMIDLRADLKPHFNLDWEPETRANVGTFLFFILKNRSIWASASFFGAVLFVLLFLVISISCDHFRHYSLQSKHSMREAETELSESDDSLI